MNRINPIYEHIANKLNELLGTLELKKDSQLSDRMGIDQSKFSRIKNAKRRIFIEELIDLAKATGQPLNYFLPRDTWPILFAEIEKGKPIESPIRLVPVEGFVNCGPIDFIERDEDGPEIELPESWLGPSRDAFLLRARGTSMLGRGIRDGSLLIIQPLHGQQPKDGDVVLFQQTGKGETLKIYRTFENISWLMASDEAGERPIPLNRTLEARVIGKLTKLIRDF